MEYQKIKNIIEPFIALLLFCLTIPIQILIFIVLFFELKEVPVFIQERGMTLTKYRFNIYKFRTIKNNKYQSIKNIYDVFKKNYLTDYIPPICKLLRKTGLDELPQLLNVIRGEMSLIGPRPLSIDDIVIIKENNNAYTIRDKINSKPGITGLWQIYGNRNKGLENLVTLDLYYEKNISVGLDLKIALTTVFVIFLGLHSDAILSGISKKNKIKIHSTIKINS